MGTGSSAAILKIVGNGPVFEIDNTNTGLSIGSNGTLTVEPTANGSAGLAELLISSGSVILDASSTFELDVSSYTPSVGDSWDVILAPGIVNGTFGTLNAPAGYTITQSTVARAETPEKLVITVTEVPTAPVETLYWSNSTTSDIATGNADGTGSTTVLFDNTSDGIVGVTSVAIDAEALTIYWADPGTNKVQRGNIDGSGSVEDLYTLTVGGDVGIALDIDAGKIYWSGDGNNALKRGDMDGSGAEEIIFDSGDGIGNVSELALDIVAGKVYWTGSNSITRGNMDGTGTPETVYDTTASGDEATNIAIDLVEGKIYWTEQSNQYIVKGDMDGSGASETLFDNPNDGISDCWSLVVDLANRYLYWSDSGNDSVKRGNLDGIGLPTLLFNIASDDVADPFGIALNPEATLETVWVDFGDQGANDGSESDPYQTIGQAIARITPGIASTIILDDTSGTAATDDSVLISKAMTLTATGGAITIGAAPETESRSGFRSR